MGYSISVAPTTKKQAEEVFAAAERLMSACAMDEGYRLSLGDVSYPPSVRRKDLVVGIDASRTDEYMWGIMAYLAKRFNLTDKHGDLVFYYDSEKMVVKPSSDRDNPDQNGEDNRFFINDDGSPHIEQKTFNPLHPLVSTINMNEAKRRQEASNVLAEAIKSLDIIAPVNQPKPF